MAQSRLAVYLLDTNIWLERLLNQEQSAIVGRLLDSLPAAQIHITDFSLHSICVILGRHRRFALLNKFLHDAFSSDGIDVVSLSQTELQEVVEVCTRYHLDFDDAYQYVAAKRYQLTLVSFDADLDVTPLGRKLPADLLRKDDAPT